LFPLYIYISTYARTVYLPLYHCKINKRQNTIINPNQQTDDPISCLMLMLLLIMFVIIVLREIDTLECETMGTVHHS